MWEVFKNTNASIWNSTAENHYFPHWASFRVQGCTFFSHTNSTEQETTRIECFPSLNRGVWTSEKKPWGEMYLKTLPWQTLHLSFLASRPLNQFRYLTYTKSPAAVVNIQQDEYCGQFPDGSNTSSNFPDESLLFYTKSIPQPAPNLPAPSMNSSNVVHQVKLS